MAAISYWNYPSSNGDCVLIIRDGFNIKKENIEASLNPRDTIVLQEKTVKMIKLF